MKLDVVENLLAEILEDRRVPRNIRSAIEEARKNLTEDDRDMDIKLSSAISILDEITNDPNIPTYTRTQIWNIVSMLEVARREL